MECNFFQTCTCIHFLCTYFLKKLLKKNFFFQNLKSKIWFDRKILIFYQKSEWSIWEKNFLPFEMSITILIHLIYLIDIFIKILIRHEKRPIHKIWISYHCRTLRTGPRRRTIRHNRTNCRWYVETWSEDGQKPWTGWDG